VYFYLDDRLIWSPEKKLNAEMMVNRNLFLGYLSPGTSGKAFHDFVTVSYPKVIDPDPLSQPEKIVE
jgi:hypothetical protein